MLLRFFKTDGLSWAAGLFCLLRNTMNRQLLKLWPRLWLTLVCVPLTRTPEPLFEPVGSGLDNPSGLAFVHDIALYIADLVAYEVDEDPHGTG